METEERELKINSILNDIQEQTEYPDIPEHLWVAQPGTPEHEEWLRICTQIVDIERAKGNYSGYEGFLCDVEEYGRRELRTDINAKK